MDVGIFLNFSCFLIMMILIMSFLSFHLHIIGAVIGLYGVYKIMGYFLLKVLIKISASQMLRFQFLRLFGIWRSLRGLKFFFENLCVIECLPRSCVAGGLVVWVIAISALGLLKLLAML